MQTADEIRTQVRDYYAARASGTACCGDAASSCCGVQATEGLEEFTGPSLGCGTPLQYAAVREGETVVDLGSGAGREVLLAARQAGSSGRAVGIDMTPEMIWKARDNARRTATSNAEFRLGEMEHIPLADDEVNVVVSNCVINLVPDKSAAFQEAFRVLRPGGRLVVSDIVTNGPLPAVVRAAAEAWAACVAGALDVRDYLEAIRGAGFTDVEVLDPTTNNPAPIFSVTIRARKAEQAGTQTSGAPPAGTA